MIRSSGQHSLDFDGDAVAVDNHCPAGDGQVVGQHLHLVLFGGVELDDGAAAEPHHLMDGHGGRPEDDHQIDGNLVEGGHGAPDSRNGRCEENTMVMVS